MHTSDRERVGTSASSFRRPRLPSTTKADPGPGSDPALQALLRLQRTAGNDAVTALIRQRDVTRPPGALQRSMDAHGMVCRSAAAGPEGGFLEQQLVERIQTERGNGRPIAPLLRQDAEHVVGTDLSAVRIHTDGAATDLTKQLGARAFTTGRDIFFGESTSPADRGVLLHEVTHAVQQRMNEEPPRMVGAADTPYERAAENTAIAESTRAQAVDRCLDDEAQRSLGRTLLQRDSDGDESPSDDSVYVSPPADFSVQLPGTTVQEYALADLRTIDPDFAPGMPQEPGPSQTEEPGTAMAMRVLDVLQRQDAPTGLPDKPAGGGGGGGSGDGAHLGTDVQAGWSKGATYPWTLQTTVVYRDLNFRQFPNVLRGLDILHEPQATFLFSISPSELLSAQLGVGLVNLHIPSLFGTELEAQILAQAQHDSSQGDSAGVNLQLEQHIWKGISATVNLSGMWGLPTPGTPAGFQVAPGGGITIHAF
jgi:hypothetical protein